MNRAVLGGLPVDLLTPETVRERIGQWLARPERSYQVVTLNALMVMAAEKHPELKRAIAAADLVVIDGIGISRALRRGGVFPPPRYRGVDLVRDLLAHASWVNRSVYFYGASRPVLDRLRAIAVERWPGIRIAGMWDGYRPEDARSDILAKRPDILLAALGTPRQELFLASVLKELPGTVGIGVGGSFDVLAGMKQEAPLLLQAAGMEWLFRMVREPARLAKLPDLARFWAKYVLLGRGSEG